MKRVVWVLTVIALLLVAAGVLWPDSGNAPPTRERAIENELVAATRARAQSAPEPESAPTATIAHRFDVSDADGRPLGAAHVRLFRESFESRDWGLGWQTIAGMRRVERTPDAEATTDERGRAVAGELGGVYRYDVTVAGHARAVGTLELDLGSGVGRTAVELRPGHRFAGRIVDDAGAPLAEREIVLGSGDLFSHENAWLRHHARTDADGRFVSSSLAAGTYEVWTRDQWSGHRHLGTYAVPGVGETSFVLPRGAVIRGRVVIEGTDEPIADARVEFLDRQEADSYRGSAELVATTDADGRFEARSIGMVTVRAARVRAPKRLETRVPDNDGAWDCFEIGYPAERDILIEVPRLARVEGVVRGPAGPIEGAQVDVDWSEDGRGFSRGMEASARTDADGRYAVEGVPPGHLRVVVWADGFAPSSDPHARFDRGGASRELGAEDRVVIWDHDLRPDATQRLVTATFHGVVERPDGSPAAGARVWLTGSYRGWHVGDLGGAVAGSDGRFVVTGEANAGSFFVSASLGGSGNGYAEASAGEIVVRLSAGDAPMRRIRGRVQRKDGSVPVGVEVAVVQMLVHGKNDASYAWDTFPRAHVQPGGRFEMDVPAESYGFDSHSYNPVAVIAIGAFAPGHGLVVSDPIDLEKTEHPAPLELTLPPAYALEGQVLDAAGAPLPGADVSLRGASSEGWREHDWLPRYPPSFDAATFAITGADGRFRVEGLSGETYEVTVSASGRHDASVVVSLPSPQPLRIVSRRPCAIAGEVVDEAGTPVSGVSVRVAAAGSTSAGSTSAGDTTWTDASGKFRLEDAPEGPLRLHLGGPWEREDLGQTLTAEIVAPRAEVRLVIEPPRTIRGVVKGLDGLPLADLPVTAHPKDDRFGETREDTDSDGHFEIVGVGGCPHDVVVAGDVTVEFRDVEPGASLDVAPEGTASLAGVLPECGPDAVRVTRILPSGELSRRSTTIEVERDGSFSITGLAAARYRLELGEVRFDEPGFDVARSLTVTVPQKDLRFEE